MFPEVQGMNLLWGIMEARSRSNDIVFIKQGERVENGLIKYLIYLQIGAD